MKIPLISGAVAWAARNSKKIGETFNKARSAIQKQAGKKQETKVEPKKTEAVKNQPTPTAKSQENAQIKTPTSSKDKVREKAAQFENKHKHSFPAEEVDTVQPQSGGKPSNNTNGRYRAKGWDDSRHQSHGKSRDQGMDI